MALTPNILQYEEYVKGLPTSTLQQVLSNPSSAPQLSDYMFLVTAELSDRKKQQTDLMARQGAQENAGYSSVAQELAMGDKEPMSNIAAEAAAPPPGLPPQSQLASTMTGLDAVSARSPDPLPTISAQRGLYAGMASSIPIESLAAAPQNTESMIAQATAEKNLPVHYGGGGAPYGTGPGFSTGGNIDPRTRGWLAYLQNMLRQRERARGGREIKTATASNGGYAASLPTVRMQGTPRIPRSRGEMINRMISGRAQESAEDQRYIDEINRGRVEGITGLPPVDFRLPEYQQNGGMERALSVAGESPEIAQYRRSQLLGGETPITTDLSPDLTLPIDRSGVPSYDLSPVVNTDSPELAGLGSFDPRIPTPEGDVMTYGRGPVDLNIPEYSAGKVADYRLPESVTMSDLTGKAIGTLPEGGMSDTQAEVDALRVRAEEGDPSAAAALQEIQPEGEFRRFNDPMFSDVPPLSGAEVLQRDRILKGDVEALDTTVGPRLIDPLKGVSEEELGILRAEGRIAALQAEPVSQVDFSKQADERYEALIKDHKVELDEQVKVLTKNTRENLNEAGKVQDRLDAIQQFAEGGALPEKQRNRLVNDILITFGAALTDPKNPTLGGAISAGLKGSQIVAKEYREEYGKQLNTMLTGVAQIAELNNTIRTNEVEGRLALSQGRIEFMRGARSEADAWEQRALDYQLNTEKVNQAKISAQASIMNAYANIIGARAPKGEAERLISGFGISDFNVGMGMKDGPAKEAYMSARFVRDVETGDWIRPKLGTMEGMNHEYWWPRILQYRESGAPYATKTDVGLFRKKFDTFITNINDEKPSVKFAAISQYYKDWVNQSGVNVPEDVTWWDADKGGIAGKGPAGDTIYQGQFAEWALQNGIVPYIEQRLREEHPIAGTVVGSPSSLQGTVTKNDDGNYTYHPPKPTQ